MIQLPIKRWKKLFQLTTSQGGRQPGNITAWRIAWTFNSRPHKEVDILSLTITEKLSTFNSRPHKEVDMDMGVYQCNQGLSTHDLTRRSTNPFLYISSYIWFFQLTTSQGGRRKSTNKYTVFTVFQLTTSQGGRPRLRVWISWTKQLSTHDLTRRSTLLL